MRQTFDQAIGAAPVSTIDVNDVVSKARRHGRWRRLAVVGAAGGTSIVVVAAGIVVTMVLATSPRTTSEVRLPGLLPSSPPSTAEVPAGAAPVHAGETQEQTGQRIAYALTAGLTAALPGAARLSNGPTGAPDTVAFFTPNYAGQNVGQYSTDTVVTTPTTEQEVFLESWVGGRVPTGGPTGESQRLNIVWFESCSAMPELIATMPDGHTSVRECEVSIGPAGQTIVAVTDVCVECPGRPSYGNEVFVTWTNARVHLSIAQDTKRGDSHKPHVPTLLSVEQLVAIAVSPELTAAS